MLRDYGSLSEDWVMVPALNKGVTFTEDTGRNNKCTRKMFSMLQMSSSVSSSRLCRIS